MLLTKVKQNFALKIKTAGGLNIPSDEDLSEIFFEALVYVATKCIPRELLCASVSTTDTSILRFIGGGDFIAMPEYPDFTSAEKHLQIDEDLNFAVINKAAALFSRDATSITKFENEASQVINRYKANFSKIKEQAL